MFPSRTHSALEEEDTPRRLFLIVHFARVCPAASNKVLSAFMTSSSSTGLFLGRSGIGDRLVWLDHAIFARVLLPTIDQVGS